MVIYPLVAAIYFAICWPLSQLSRSLEKRIDASLGIKRHL
jgi:polar amino acid transport system permease protein